LLEGLEISVIYFSEFSLENSFIRLDSEYQSKERKAVINYLRSVGAARFGDSNPEIMHPQEIVRSYVESDGVWFFRAQNIRPMIIDQVNQVFVSKKDACLLSKNELRHGDVVITRTGANAGDCALFTAKEQTIASSHTFIVRSSYWPHSYLTTFLNSRFGRIQIINSRYGAAQPEIAPYYLRNIWIPPFSNALYEKIEHCFVASSEQIKFATECLTKAESTLLDALGLNHWQPPEALYYERNSRDVFAAGRLDAEYFHPAKSRAIADLSALSDYTVGDLFKSIRDLWQPGDDISIDWVRNYDLTDALNPFLEAAKEPVESGTIASTKKRIAPGDLVVSRLRSYLREIALVQSADHIPMVASTEFIVLRSKAVQALPVEALLIYLRSLLPQIIFKWSQDGSNHPRFNEKELLRLPIPRILINDSDKYVKVIRAMIDERKKAAKLLAAAKRAVEIAIENDEQTALAYLESQQLTE